MLAPGDGQQALRGGGSRHSERRLESRTGYWCQVADHHRHCGRGSPAARQCDASFDITDMYEDSLLESALHNAQPGQKIIATS